MEAFSAGTLAGAGSFRCDSCGFAVALHERDPVPACPECGGRVQARVAVRRGRCRRPTTTTLERAAGLARGGARRARPAGRLPRLRGRRARARRPPPGGLDPDRPQPLGPHPLRRSRPCRAGTRCVYRDADGARILDDRSLNGVFRNGERVELAELEDGDEIDIGRFRMFYVSLVANRTALAG